MKICLLCGETAPDSAETCPSDGEASWQVSTPDPKLADDAPKSRAERKASK